MIVRSKIPHLHICSCETNCRRPKVPVDTMPDRQNSYPPAADGGTPYPPEESRDLSDFLSGVVGSIYSHSIGSIYPLIYQVCIALCICRASVFAQERCKPQRA